MPSPEATENPTSPRRQRVLVAHDDVGTLRLLRETLAQFTDCEVDTSPTALYAFELAVERDYALFIFGLSLPVISGDLLYELLSKAYPHCHSSARTCPGIVYITDTHEANQVEALQREARVKGVLAKPLAIDRILDRVKGSLPLREEAAGFGP